MKTAGILRQLRENKGYKQKEIADYLRVSCGTISNYENDIHQPCLNTLSKLADLYGVSTDYILGRTECYYGIDILNTDISKNYTYSQLINQLESLSARKKTYVAYTVQLLFKALNT